MKYILDTCIVSEFFKGNVNVMKQIKSISPNDLGISSITVMEIEFGLSNNPAFAKKNGDIIRQFMNQIQIIDLDTDIAAQAGHIRAHLKSKGTPIGAYDLLIGATAVHHNVPLVTNNTREFQRIPKIILNNWV